MTTTAIVPDSAEVADSLSAFLDEALRHATDATRALDYLRTHYPAYSALRGRVAAHAVALAARTLRSARTLHSELADRT